MKKLTSEACWEKIRKLADVLKMIRLNLWLKVIWFLCSDCETLTVLVSVSMAAIFGVLSKCLSEFPGFACTLTIANGLECVSAPFMLRAGVFSLCPFQRHRVGDGLSPVASLTKVHELRVALFNFCFLYNTIALLTALSFMGQRTPSCALSQWYSSPPSTSVYFFMSPRLLAGFSIFFICFNCLEFSMYTIKACEEMRTFHEKCIHFFFEWWYQLMQGVHME